MCIRDRAWDDEVAAEVELALEMRSVLPRASDIGNALPVGPELAVENGAVPRTEHGHDAGVIEPVSYTHLDVYKRQP